MKNPAEGANEAEKRFDTIRALNLDEPDTIRAYENIVELLESASEMPITLFTVLTKDRQVFKAARGVDVDSTPIEQAFCNWTVHQKDRSKCFIVEDASTDSRFNDNPLVTDDPKIRFYAGTPIVAPNNVPIGALCLIDTVARKSSPKFERILMCARSILEDALLMQITSVKDHLTGMYNKRYFEGMLASEARRAYRHAIPCTAMMVDIDNFKLFNDRYGHDAGDQAIKAVANLLNGVLHRAGDVAARYGGEEFVLLLPNTGVDGATTIANNITHGILNLKIAHSDAATGFLSVSIGAAVAMSKENLDPESLIKLADELLYQSKTAGRNTSTIRIATDVSAP